MEVLDADLVAWFFTQFVAHMLVRAVKLYTRGFPVLLRLANKDPGLFGRIRRISPVVNPQPVETMYVTEPFLGGRGREREREQVT